MNWIIYALASAVLNSASTVIEKKVLVREHSMEYSAGIAFLIALLSLPYLFVADLGELNWTILGIIYVGSLSAAGAYLFVAKAVRHMEVSETTPLLNLGPAVTAFLAVIFLGESLNHWQVVGIGFMILGIYYLEGSQGSAVAFLKRLFLSKYNSYIVFALILYGLSSITDQMMIHYFNLQPALYLGIIHIFIAINFLVVMQLFFDGWHGIKLSLKRGGWLMALASVLTILERFFMMTSLQSAFVGLATGVKRVSSLFTTIIGGGIFHEKNLIHKFTACLVILSGIVLLVL